MKNTFSVQRHRGKRGFAKVQGDWHSLMNSVSTQSFYQHPAWFQAYYDRPRVGGDPIDFLCVYRKGALVAVLPATIRQRYRGILTEATFATSAGLYMPDIVIDDGVDRRQIWCALRSMMAGARWDMFTARDVLESSFITDCMSATMKPKGRPGADSRCATIDIIDYEDTYRSLNKKFRGNLNNARHRLNAQESVVFQCVTGGPALEPAFSEFVELEKSGWKGQSERKQDFPPPAAIGLKKSKLLFYNNVVREFAKLGAIEICLLKVNSKTVGAQILLLLNSRSFLLKTAFDESAKGFAPGHMLIDNALQRYSADNRISSLCLITDYEWFAKWNPRYTSYVSGTEFSRTIGGRLAHSVASTKRFFSKNQVKNANN